MYNYTVYVKRLNDKFKKQEHTEIVDSTISNTKWQQQCNSTDTNTLLNQNSFEITNNIEHNKAENMRDIMMLKKEEIKEAEMEHFISNM